MIIGVTGGKGGTGKSTIATALAYELSRKHKVLLLDADVGCPNDHLILSIKRKKEKSVYQTVPKWDFSKCIKCGKCSSVCRGNAIVFIKDKYPIFVPEQCNGCRACIISCPAKAISAGKKEVGVIYSGRFQKLEFLSGEMIPGTEEASPIINAVKDFVKKDYDFIIIDTAAGAHCNVISALMGCDMALAVTEPTPLGAYDLKLIIKLLKVLKIPSKIILNKSTIGDKGLIKYRNKIIAEIPYKKSILKSYSNGEPVKEEAIVRIADYLERLK